MQSQLKKVPAQAAVAIAVNSHGLLVIEDKFG
jgi:hypothetical protein